MMETLNCDTYHRVFDSVETLPTNLAITDHLLGFNYKFHNSLLDHINQHAMDTDKRYDVILNLPLEKAVKDLYPNLNLRFKNSNWLFEKLSDYRQCSSHNLKNFVCSFNGYGHVGRQLLVAILHKFNFFNPEYCSKNFTYTSDNIYGHIQMYAPELSKFYERFFLVEDATFEQTIYNLNIHPYNHPTNILLLETKLINSFLNLIGETIPTSYCPFVTEKFIYSIVTKGLFLCYAQPGWHTHVEKYYGFKQYTQIFDYKFDNIQNPIERLIELITMISTFSFLSSISN